MPVFVKKMDELNLGTTKREPLPPPNSKRLSKQRQPVKRKSTKTTFMDALGVDLVFKHFFSHLDITRILPLKRLNKRTNKLVNDNLQVRFVLQFFDGVVWEESDLDIIAQHGDNADGIGHYLIKEEGYTVQLSEDNPDEDPYTRVEDILKLTTYVRPWMKGPKTGESKIQVVSTRSLPIRAVIGGVYTTAVANIISWNKAYSVFPDATFAGRETFMLYPLNDRHKAGILKYANRVLWAPGPMAAMDVWQTGTRGLGEVARPSTPDSVLEHACFTVTHANLKYKYREHEGADRSFQPGPNFQIVCNPLRSPALQYIYTHGNTLGKGGFWPDIAAKLSEMTRKEIDKMEKKDRPRGYPHYSQNFEKPLTWTYYDDQIPQWCKEWEDERLRGYYDLCAELRKMRVWEESSENVSGLVKPDVSKSIIPV